MCQLCALFLRVPMRFHACRISFLGIIRRLFKSIIKLLNTSRGQLSCKHYGFWPARSKADAVITHRMRTIALDISKTFDKVWHWRLLHKLYNDRDSGRALSIIKSFLICRGLKAIVNGQSMGTHTVHAGVPHCSFLGFNRFLLYINHLSKITLTSLIMRMMQQFQGAPPKIWNLADHLPSDLARVAQLGKDLLVKFNAAKTKELRFHHNRADSKLSPIMINLCSLREAPCVERRLGLNFTPRPQLKPIYASWCWRCLNNRFIVPLH